MKTVKNTEQLTLISCKCCGKNFIKPPINTYAIKKKNKVTHFCSYTCWRKMGGGEWKKH